jgi:hypothetical protein
MARSGPYRRAISCNSSEQADQNARPMKVLCSPIFVAKNAGEWSGVAGVFASHSLQRKEMP